MSDLNRPREKSLKEKIKGLFHRLISADRPHDERPGGSRLFMKPAPADSILTRSRSKLTRAPPVMGEGTSLVCLQCANKFIGSYPSSLGVSECDAGSSQLHYDRCHILCGSKCVSCDNNIDGLRH